MKKGSGKLYLSVMVLLILIAVLAAGCTNQDRTKVKGIKERGKLDEEPTITVELPTGGTKTMLIEEYITGVVAGEMEADWPINAYAAQAIIARTYAMEYMESKNTRKISGDFKESQAYHPEKVTDDIRKAIKITRGEVALYEGEYIRAWFHASAGGQTTSAKVGLAFEYKEPPYTKKVKSPDDEAPADVKSWRASFTTSSIREAIKELTGTDVGEIREFRIGKKDDTGRAINFIVQGSNGNEDIEAARLRTALDPVQFKSTKLASAKLSGQKVIFSGSGYGHGVGMSQWGAYAMAKEGKSPEDIVKYYFNDIEIKEMWD
ncbi:MAG: SpoIID/LytB domain-containing protein [Halanaerobium sp.]|nr:SpoIID/LytB domain-containing protein [Halanaerobium sp.]